MRFIYVPSADSTCRTTDNAVLFSVEPTYTTVDDQHGPCRHPRGPRLLTTA